MTTRYGRTVACAAAMALALAACGGGDDDDSGSGEEASVETDSPAPAEEPVDTATDEPADEPEPAPDDTGDEASDDTLGVDDGSSDETFTPGAIEFRAVNLLDEPVDLYARTTGLVEAYPIQSGLAPGEVSQWVTPPEDGTFLVTQAGADDPTCVTTCDHFVAQLSTFETEGPTRTVVLWGDEFDPYQAFELWEQPTDEALDSANSMAPPEPGASLAVVTAIALTDADFGVRAGTAAGCLESVNLDGSILVGGNQTPAFALDPGDATISFFDRDDLDCAEAPVGGPFDVGGDAGSRSHVILSGSPGSMDAIILPMESGDDVPSDAGETSADGGDAAGGGADRDLAIELLTADIASDGLFDAEQSACFATLLVDAVGPDVVVVDGELTELDPATIPPEVATQLFDAFGAAVDECGIDPALLGL